MALIEITVMPLIRNSLFRQNWTEIKAEGKVDTLPGWIKHLFRNYRDILFTEYSLYCFIYA